MEVSLVMFTKNGERRDFDLRDDSAIIGRTKDCDIQIPLGVVSRQHCELTIQNDKLLVRDMGSSNGTFVNNTRVQHAQLKPGETLTIGPVIFTVVIDGQPATIKPVRTMVGKTKKSEHNHKPKSPPPSPRPSPKVDDTGSIDLDDSAELEIMGDSDDSNNPLAALEELSKQKKSRH